jgi:hypothetical protein
MTSGVDDDTKPPRKSKHRKERKEGSPEKSKKCKDKEEGDGSVNEPEKETRKKEKKKKGHGGDAQKDGADSAGEGALESKRKRDVEINDEEALARTSPKKKQKKTHKSDEHESANLKKKKKSKSAGGNNEESLQATKPSKKSKKSRKNKTGFFDPEQDEETDLPEQARKGAALSASLYPPSLTAVTTTALSYAFCRFHDPDSWKFNKARQNWLVRNLWNFQSVRDSCSPPTLLKFDRSTSCLKSMKISL